MALLTDNAGELDGHLMQEICRLLDIDKQHTSFYHPETNSVAERFHGTMNAVMGKVVSDSQKDRVCSSHLSWLPTDRQSMLAQISPELLNGGERSQGTG